MEECRNVVKKKGKGERKEREKERNFIR